MSLGRRERLADWLMLVAGPLLLASLFLTWSHQFSAAVLARYGTSAALQGVPHAPDAWQVYSSVDVLLALVAGGLIAAALRGGRVSRWVLAGALALAAAFTVHAVGTPPTNDATLFDSAASPAAYVHNVPRAGTGETLALVALGLGAAGLLVSFTTDP